MADSQCNSARNKPHPENELLAAAFDAAACAVACIIFNLGARNGSVSLADGSNLLPRKHWNQRLAEAAAVSLLCGVLARRKRWREGPRDTCKPAIAAARTLLEPYAVSTPELDAYLQQMTLAARDLIRDRVVWRQVQAVAGELATHLRLTRSEIAEVMITVRRIQQ